MLTADSWRRCFVVAWLMITALGGFSHRMSTELSWFRDSWLVRVLPHLRYGYVMFSDIPRHAAVTHYRSQLFTGQQPARQLPRTSAWGYADARIAINLLLYPAYRQYLCGNSSERPTEIVQSIYTVSGEGRRLVKQNFFSCP